MRPISTRTTSGTSTGTPGCRRTSRSPTSVRKIRGEEFTTRLEITFNVLLHLLNVDLAGFNLGMVQRHQEVSAAQAGDRRNAENASSGTSTVTVAISSSRPWSKTSA